MNKYVCPKCGCQLRAWQEYIYEKQVLINTKTGKPYKRVVKTPIECNYHHSGLQCTNYNCNFILNMVLGEISEYEYLKEIEYEL